MPKKIDPEAKAAELRRRLEAVAVPPQKELVIRLAQGAAHSALFPDSLARTRPFSAERVRAIEDLRSSDPQGIARAQAIVNAERREMDDRLQRERDKAWQFFERHDLLKPSAAPEDLVEIIASGRDWASYRNGRESVFAIARSAVESLVEDPTARRNVMAAVVNAIVGTWMFDAETEASHALEKLGGEDLLSALLQLFDLANAPAGQQWFILMGLMEGPRQSDAQELGKLKRSRARAPTPAELEAATPLLREVVGGIQRIRVGPIISPQDYKRTIEPLVSRWNNEVLDRSWEGIPLLCKICWKPVLLRQFEFTKTSKGRQHVARSETCSPACTRRDNRRSGE